jgi:hypothetical protein
MTGGIDILQKAGTHRRGVREDAAKTGKVHSGGLRSE